MELSFFWQLYLPRQGASPRKKVLTQSRSCLSRFLPRIASHCRAQSYKLTEKPYNIAAAHSRSALSDSPISADSIPISPLGWLSLKFWLGRGWLLG